MAFILPALQVASLAVGAWGISESAKAGRKSATSENLAAGIEAQQLEARAKATLAEGSFSAERIGKKAAEILAQRRANAAAGNNSSSDQSEMALQADTIRNASIDQLLEMANAEADANKDRYQAAVTRQTGQRQSQIRRNQTRANTISGIATLANAGTQYDWSQTFGT